MRFRPTNRRPFAKRSGQGGFTLVEVLAALLFMAIVIPAAVQGLRVASLAGQLGQRKAVAARIGERVLNEIVVTRQWRNAVQSGVVQEGPIEFQWRTRTEPWLQQNVLRLLTVEVSFPIQGKDYEVRLSTLVDATM